MIGTDEAPTAWDTSLIGFRAVVCQPRGKATRHRASIFFDDTRSTGIKPIHIHARRHLRYGKWIYRSSRAADHGNVETPAVGEHI
jgi:hypothetical protein